MESFRALVVDQKDGKHVAGIQKLPSDSLPKGDVLISILYSSLNYKDALAVTGKGKIIRRFPMVPGIDLAGVIKESSSPSYKPEDKVILTGWGLGEDHWGGYSQLNCVESDWLLHLPKGLSLKQAMGIGTAGLTAMFCVMALEEHGLKPDPKGEVMVTGAGGGVGSMAVAILSKLGYTVAASTGRAEIHEYLRQLGAKKILGREEFSVPSEKPLKHERWIGAIDSVGGTTLASLLGEMKKGTGIAACGLAGGAHLNTTVYPFILRGVNLLGIDSSRVPNDRRTTAWNRLAKLVSPALLDEIVKEVSLEQVPALSEKILKGKIRGRIVINMN